MRPKFTLRVIGIFFVLIGAGQLRAQPPSPYQETATASPNTPNEPLRPQFSGEAAVHFLDSTALNWQRENKCFACHTDFVYLLARPAVAWDVSASPGSFRRGADGGAGRFAGQGPGSFE